APAPPGALAPSRATTRFENPPSSTNSPRFTGSLGLDVSRIDAMNPSRPSSPNVGLGSAAQTESAPNGAGSPSRSASARAPDRFVQTAPLFASVTPSPTTSAHTENFPAELSRGSEKNENVVPP